MGNMLEQLSLLRLCKQRPLAIALAHEFASTKATDQARLALLNRHYANLLPVDQIRCRRELLECRAARREGIFAAVRA
jgi:hypothetical protein